MHYTSKGWLLLMVSSRPLPEPYQRPAFSLLITLAAVAVYVSADIFNNSFILVSFNQLNSYLQLEYDQEGIVGHTLQYPDNKNIINLLLEVSSSILLIMKNEV